MGYYGMREAGIRRKCGWSLSLIGHGGCSCMRVNKIPPDYIPIRIYPPASMYSVYTTTAHHRILYTAFLGREALSLL